jgi:amino acid adenylation domain-containing protein
MRFLLQHGLEHAADTHADRVAVVDGNRSLTYGELDGRANQVARLLLELGVTRGDRVGLYLDKSLESVVAVYGALKAGAVYVPLDPQAPAPRLSYIARDCDLRLLLTGAEKAQNWPELLSHGAPLDHLVVLNACEIDQEMTSALHVADRGALDAQEGSAPPLPAIGFDLAYILYTSGSTGQPKGVTLSHVNGLAFVEWAVEEFEVHDDDRLSSHAPLHFDLSIFDLFAASTAAATLVLVPAQTSFFPVEVVRFIERNEIGIWYSVPSILNMLVLRGNLTVGRLPSLRTVLFAGEVFPARYLRQLMAALPGVRFSNLYGPTETNVCTWYDVAPIPESQTEPIPIGRAITGVEVRAITEDGRPAGVGEVGELYVRGPTVMQRYWGDPDRTSRSLVEGVFPGSARDLAYRTGDLVRERPDGNYDLLGRRDHQIKTRGYRVELGDIESTLLAHADVVECAVTAVPDPVVTNRIKAYVVAGAALTESDLIEFCASRLPRHMIPETFDFRSTLPKTSTGKIDRQVLAGATTER